MGASPSYNVDNNSTNTVFNTKYIRRITLKKNTCTIYPKNNRRYDEQQQTSYDEIDNPVEYEACMRAYKYMIYKQNESW